jgi:hypothetical protein
MMTTMMMARTSTTKERVVNLLPPDDAAQRNSRGLPRTGTNDGNGGVLDDDYE